MGFTAGDLQQPRGASVHLREQRGDAGELVSEAGARGRSWPKLEGHRPGCVTCSLGAGAVLPVALCQWEAVSYISNEEVSGLIRFIYSLKSRSHSQIC